MNGRRALSIPAVLLCGTALCLGQPREVVGKDSTLLTVHIEKYLMQGDGVPDKHIFSEVRLAYPEFPDSTEAGRRAGKLIRQQMARLLNVDMKKDHFDIDSAARTFLLGFREHRRKHPESKGIWFIQLTTDTLYASDRVLTLELQDEWYGGGAHPNSTRRYYSFDRRTGRLLKLRDLFGNIPAVTRIADRIFRTARMIPDTADLRTHGFRFKNGRFRLSDNVGLTKTGVMTYFNPYEVTPYSMGGILVALPLGEIGPYLKVR
jgi:hypothetical protein